MSSRTTTVYSEALPPSESRVRCQVVVIDGPDAGRAATLGATDSELVIGTAEDCDLVLTDERVSARHLAIAAAGGRFRVRDLGSKNGFLYEGSLIEAAVVPVGATIKLGRSFVRIQPQPRALDIEPSQSRRFGELVAESLAMREVFAVLELAAQSEVTVLLEGETGTGKELTARAIHEAGDRRKGPFVAVDCGALPENLLDSELFGHVRGAFTGAAHSRAGAFVRAHGGTIFLDELGSVPESVQARLLRVLEERKVKPVGADEERSVDVRVIAASRHDLETRIAEGAFRSDLYYRLSVVRVILPPLRARREDIPMIVGEIMRRRGLEPGDVHGPNLDVLYARDWPGNVRELRNVVDRAIALSPGATCFDDLRLAPRTAAADEPRHPGAGIRTDLPYAEAKQAVLHEFERRYLRDVLARHAGNISAMAREIGLDRKHLRTLLHRHGLIGS